MTTALTRAQHALSCGLVDPALVHAALGGAGTDLLVVGRYLQLPVAERPTLSLYFDRAFYLATNPDIEQSGDDPFLHFIESGLAELRSPHPLIDIVYIIEQDRSVFHDPPRIDELVDLLDYDLAAPSPYFDLAYYGQELGPATPQRGLLRHFLAEGLAHGRRPNALFDPAWYSARYEDLPRDPYAALRHFIMSGDAEGRAAGPSFDGQLYRSRYPDVADAAVPPLRHFLSNGRREGRSASVERAVVAEPRPRHDEYDVAAPRPIDAGGIEAEYAALRARLATLRLQRKDAVDVVSPTMVSVEDPARTLADLAFPAVSAPTLSVVIPIFNEMRFTLACLVALLRDPPSCAYEVIIADDCSTDADIGDLGKIPNLVYVRQDANRGFIHNCNAAFARCRGAFVLLLNNDTQPQRGAIDALVAVLAADPTIAAAGPKLIYPDGRLQEAGCYIKPNGESGMVGLFRDPDESIFLRDRDVPYCSGAALMLRRSAVGETLFDEVFSPAYCEDADLCLRLIAAGHRVRFVAGAVIVHHLSVSSNRQSISRKMRLIVRNQHRLIERWGDRLRAMDRVRPIAFYLPQFHPTPENDLWWGAGFTEWTNVVKARPSYSGHYQPHLPTDLGFYDLRTPETLARQAALAARYGVEGFCVYYYSFGDRRVLSRPLELLRAHPEIPFRFCLCWANENWTKHWDGGSREVLLAQKYDAATLDAIIADVVGFATDPRAIRVNGRPMFLIYRPLLLPDPKQFADACRAAFANAGLAGVHLVYVESMEAIDAHVEPTDIGFDGCVEFPPQGRALAAKTQVDFLKPGWSGYRYDYAETAMSFINRDNTHCARYPAVFPSWDNTPRQSLKATTFEGCSPEAFRFFIEEKIEELRHFQMGDERLLFINAWNEWAEGTHLEPDTGYGHRWLEALRDAIDASRYA